MPKTFAPERAPVRELVPEPDDAETRVPEPPVPEPGLLPESGGKECESRVCSESKARSKCEPHLEQTEDSSSFSVLQWGQIIGKPASPRVLPSDPDYVPGVKRPQANGPITHDARDFQGLFSSCMFTALEAAESLVYKLVFMRTSAKIVSRFQRIPNRCTVSRFFLFVAIVLGVLPGNRTAVAAVHENITPEKYVSRGVQIVVRGGYPELRVDGVPFFVHSAAFHYYRIPRDQWSFLLDRYRAMGINTIDIYIPWNWHEPREGEFDFDGHTNPRRDLRALLQLITADGFRLIARPGPEILNEWRNGGYPDWLLRRPEYHMPLADVIEGRYPPLASLNTHNAEQAAQAWLANPTNMNYARTWLEAVAHELAPYSAGRAVQIPGEAHEFSGPLLFVQLEDDMAIGRANYAGREFWRYMQALREMLHDGGLEVPAYINPTDMRVSAAGEALPDPIGAMGQWYMPPGTAEQTDHRLLGDTDANQIEFYTEELKTQPLFPPVMIEFQAGWYAPGDDDRPEDSPVENTLLSSRLLIGNGIHGINYFPLQDTVTPAGYSVPWANRFYNWDAPLDPNGEEQPRARAVIRNANVLRLWGKQLASSHKRADFGIVYPLGSFPQTELNRDDISLVSTKVLRLETLAQLAHMSSELLDPEYQPVEQLLRDPVILLPAFDANQPEFQMSDDAARKLVDYVRRGGILVAFPIKPAGNSFLPLWQSPDTLPNASGAIAEQWRYGSGRVFLISKDFASWIGLEKSYSANASTEALHSAIATLNAMLNAAGVRPVLQVASNSSPAPELVVSQLVSDDGTGPLGERTGGQGFLSVTNLSGGPIDEDLEILSPLASARTKGPADETAAFMSPDYIPLHVEIPPRESELLPLEQPLCSAPDVGEPCHDVVIAAGAELLGLERQKQTLELSFYSPSRASILLHLPQEPYLKGLPQSAQGFRWDEKNKELELSVSRGAAPGYHRAVNVELNEIPQVPEESRDHAREASSFALRVLNAVSLELGDTSQLDSNPPLVPLVVGQPAELLFEAEPANERDSLKLSIRLQGVLHGSCSLLSRGRNFALTRMELKGTSDNGLKPGLSSAADGFLHETLLVRSHSGEQKLPIDFLLTHSGGEYHYRFDFDRDGADEWVLENDRLRLIVTPRLGGRGIALEDKKSTLDLISSVGALRDGFSYYENSPGTNPARMRGRYGLFNRLYAAKWSDARGKTVLQMHYDAPDILPGGASIEKRIYFEADEGLEADYTVSLAAPAGGAAFTHPQSFILENSVAVASRLDKPTSFCWASNVKSEVANSTPDAPEKQKDSEDSTMHCETFVPRGHALSLPANVERLEIRTPGQPGLVFEWRDAQMIIEQKNFSALLKLQFPPLVPGGPAGKYAVRIWELPYE
jgi:Glycosyl hydrolases family 35